MDRKLVGLMVIFFLSFLVFISVFTFNKPLKQLLRAKEETDPSPVNSLLLAWPLTLPADGKSVSTITIFLRNQKGKPVPNKIVSLRTTLGKLNEDSVTSGQDGKAEFHLTSSTKGVAEVKATASGVELLHQVTIKFE